MYPFFLLDNTNLLLVILQYHCFIYYDWEKKGKGEPIFIKYGWIWHFNGLPREERNNLMKQTWEAIEKNDV